MLDSRCLEHPRHTGDLADEEGNAKADREGDHRQQYEHEQSRKLNSLQRNRNEHHDRDVDEVDGIALLRQELSEAAIRVEIAAEECQPCQGHSDCEERVPERIHSRLPGSVPQKRRGIGEL